MTMPSSPSSSKQKKNKLRSSSTKESAIVVTRNSSPPSLPHQNIQFDYDNKEEYLGYVNNLGAIKSWLRECCNNNINRREPQLYYVHHSFNLTSPIPSWIKENIVKVVTSRILPHRNTKIASKFTTISSNQVKSSYNTFVELTGTGSPALMVYYLYENYSTYCRVKTKLTEYECNTIDSFDSNKKSMQFSSVVKFEGIFCALSLQGSLAVLQETDSCFTIMAVSSNRIVPSVSSRFFRENMFELTGEILLVFLIHQKSTKIVDQVEVFRLGFPDLNWTRVDRLRGNKTLFLDGSDGCVSVVKSSENISCRENCIYFSTHGSDNGLWMYELENGCISPA